MSTRFARRFAIQESGCQRHYVLPAYAHSLLAHFAHQLNYILTLLDEECHFLLSFIQWQQLLLCFTLRASCPPGSPLMVCNYKRDLAALDIHLPNLLVLSCAGWPNPVIISVIRFASFALLQTFFYVRSKLLRVTLVHSNADANAEISCWIYRRHLCSLSP